MYGPSDMYGDLTLEDVEDFEGLEPEDGREVAPEGRFQRNEVRNFEKDFEYELNEAETEAVLYEDEFDRFENEDWDFDPNDSDMEQELQDLSEDEK